jgi:hypothetical protein
VRDVDSIDTISDKPAVQAPIAKEREMRAAAVTILWRRHSRTPNPTSRRIDSSRIVGVYLRRDSKRISTALRMWSLQREREARHDEHNRPRFGCENLIGPSL